VKDALGRGHESVMVVAYCGFSLVPFLIEARKAGLPFHNPCRAKAGAWNPMRGGPDRLLSFVRPTLPGERGLGGAPWTWRELRRWTEPLRSDGLLRTGTRALVEANARSKETSPLHVEKSDLAALFEPAAAREIQETLATREAWDWYERRMLPSWRKRLEFALAVARNGDARALAEAPRVLVGTAHSYKGWEAGCVFVSPDLSRAAWEEWDHLDKDAVRRTFYVAFTRAREELVLCGASEEYAVEWDG
jgi:hypothetical protein